MASLIRLWTVALTNPLCVFRVLNVPYQSIRFNWWTSLTIYAIAYFALFSLFLGFNVSALGGFVWLITFFLMITFTLVKNYFYTLMISYRKKQLINFQDIALLTTLSDIPVLIGLPLIYILSFWVNSGLILVAVLFFGYFLLRNRKQLFESIYEVPTRFVYMISFGFWTTLFIMMVFFSIYLGVSLQVLLSYVLS